MSRKNKYCKNCDKSIGGFGKTGFCKSCVNKRRKGIKMKGGWCHNEETKRKIRKGLLKYFEAGMYKEHRKNMRKGAKKRYENLREKEKVRERNTGYKNPNWRGGKSFESYGLEFDNKLKEKIRKRDNYRCQECFKHQDELRTKTSRKYKLMIHHIDYNKKNNKEDNLISLCRNCHMKTNFKRKDWIKYFLKKVKIV